MDPRMLKTEIDTLSDKILYETDQYFEAVTRKKDLSVARNIKLRINSLHRNLDNRLQLLRNFSVSS